MNLKKIEIIQFVLLGMCLTLFLLLAWSVLTRIDTETVLMKVKSKESISCGKTGSMNSQLKKGKL